MRTLALLTIIAAMTATAAQANSWSAPCTTAPQSQWLPVDALKAKVEAQGYTVQKGKLKNACGEFYTTDKTGAKVEVFVDPTSGAIVGKL